jgi:hypothetical protein
VTSVRTRCLTSHPLSTKSTASQSSSSGWVGHSPWEPRSSGVRASPCPKKSFHCRFTKTRAVRGFVGGGEPAREVEARGPAAFRFDLGQEVGNGRLHDLAGLVQPVAARQDAHGIRRLGGRDQGLGNPAEKLGLAQVRGAQGLAKRLQLGRHAPVEPRERVFLLVAALRRLLRRDAHDLLRDGRPRVRTRRACVRRGREPEPAEVRPWPAFWTSSSVRAVSSPRPVGSVVSTTRRWSWPSAAGKAQPPREVWPSMAAAGANPVAAGVEVAGVAEREFPARGVLDGHLGNDEPALRIATRGRPAAARRTSPPPDGAR